MPNVQSGGSKFSNIIEAMKSQVSKVEGSSGAGSAKPAPSSEGASQGAPAIPSKRESIESTGGSKGKAHTATLIEPQDSGDQKSDWYQARGKNPFKPEALGLDLKAENKATFISEFADKLKDSGKISPEEATKLKRFINEVSKEYLKQNPGRSGANDITYVPKRLAEQLDAHGLSSKQIDLISSGKFDAATCAAMIKNGEPIG